MLSRDELRLLVATVLFCGWFLLLLTGFTLGGGVHLLLALAIVLVPWRRSSPT